MELLKKKHLIYVGSFIYLFKFGFIEMKSDIVQQYCYILLFYSHYIFKYKLHSVSLLKLVIYHK